MPSKKHEDLANRLARIKKTEYHGDKGVDLRTSTQAIEVEVKAETLSEGKRQLAGTTKTPYLAVPSELVKGALEATEGTRIGVMGPSGKIYKQGRRRRQS